jgi:type I restriction enzyme M protein
VEWKKVERQVRDEAADRGFAGRFGSGLPRINDGSFLFLQHMIHHMKPVDRGGSRLAIVFNGSPLFTGAAGSGESEIRRWIIENDWLEAVIALPDQLFYNTGISTYIWIVTNRKAPGRRGTVQLVDARELFGKMRKSLGDKRKEISPEQIAEITRLYHDHAPGERVKVFPNTAFGFLRITVERPLRLKWRITEDVLAKLEAAKPWQQWAASGHGLTAAAVYGPDGSLGHVWGQTWGSAEAMRDALGANMGGGVPVEVIKDLVKHAAVADPDGTVQRDKKGHPLPDPDLRDQENVPLPDVPVTFESDVTGRLASAAYRAAVDAYMAAEVLPYVPDAWVDYEKTKVGYEVPLTRHFYTYVPPRPLAEIDEEIKRLEEEIRELLREVAS